LTPSILAWRCSTLAGVPQVKVSTKQISSDLARPPSVVGGRIRAARTRAGMTQQQVAGERYTKAYVSALENGLVRPSVTALEYLAARLGTTPSALMADSRPAWSRLDADLLLASGGWQAAADAYRAMLEASTEVAGATDPGTRAELLRGEAEALIRLDQGAEAAAHASEAVELFESLGRGTDAALASYWLSAAMYAQDNTAEAKAILQAVLAKVRTGLRVEPDFKLRLLMALSSNESRDGNHQAALSYLEEVRALAEKLDDRRRAMYLFDLAYSYCETGDYEAAIRTGYTSLALFRAADTTLDMGKLENELALAHLHTGNVARADELARSAAAHFLELRNDRQRAHVLDTQAQIELARDDWNAALRLANESLELARKSENAPAVADALLTVARAYAGLAGAPDGASYVEQAKAAFDRAATVCREGNRPQMLRRVLTEWADFLAGLGEHKAAFALTRQALATSR